MMWYRAPETSKRAWRGMGRLYRIYWALSLVLQPWMSPWFIETCPLFSLFFPQLWKPDISKLAWHLQMTIWQNLSIGVNCISQVSWEKRKWQIQTQAPLQGFGDFSLLRSLPQDALCVLLFSQVYPENASQKASSAIPVRKLLINQHTPANRTPKTNHDEGMFFITV